VVLELVLHVQRLRIGDLEATAGEVVGLGERQIQRRKQRQQPAREYHPAKSAQVAAEAHHELLDGYLPAFSPDCVAASYPSQLCAHRA
jgi:hypothetical protein